MFDFYFVEHLVGGSINSVWPHFIGGLTSGLIALGVFLLGRHFQKVADKAKDDRIAMETLNHFIELLQQVVCD